MRWRQALLALGILLLGPAAASAELPGIDQQWLKRYQRQTHYSRGALAEWEIALKASLASNSPDVAATGLAERYGLSAKHMRELVSLWLVAEAFKYSDRTEAIDAELRARFLALLAASGGSTLVVQAATHVISYRGICAPADFDALLAGARDRVPQAWVVADYADCPAWYHRFASLAPGRATPVLLRMLERRWLRPSDALSLRAYLMSKRGLAHIRPKDRQVLAIRLHRAQLDMLLDTGLTGEAFGLVDKLSTADRDHVFADYLPGIIVQADGLELRLDKVEDRGGLKAVLATALALEGRTSEAERTLASSSGLEAARKALACGYAAPARGAASGCRHFAEPWNAFAPVMLDHFLHHDSDDPYPIAEVFMVAGAGAGSSEPLARLLCRLFDERQFGNACSLARESVVRANRGDRRRQGDQADALLALAKPPGHARRAAAYAARLDRVNRALGGATSLPDYFPTPPKAIEAPPPAPFVQHPLPPSLVNASPRRVEGLDELAPLPRGFAPVRVDRDGDRAAVISLSQNYDPTGEVSRGGYWLHLSDDRGRTWKPPLYTGLAQYFPYVVRPASALPLIEDGILKLAVDVEEVDTASITYPPVALKVRRNETDLYLQIPLAELARDSDRDGLSDIAERHLLTDSPAEGAATPLVVGSGRARDCGPVTDEQQILAALLREIFSVGTGALVEPVKREEGASIIAGWESAPVSTDRPIFLVGDPEPFRCLRSDRLMIVYSKADIERLKQRTPDFHAVSMPVITLNRARDRGYAVWSAQWTGGTYRLKRESGTWTLEEISRWMT